MTGPKPLTLLQRETLEFIRLKAVAWMAEHGGQRLNMQDAGQVGRALGSAHVVIEALTQTLPATAE